MGRKRQRVESVCVVCGKVTMVLPCIAKRKKTCSIHCRAKYARSLTPKYKKTGEHQEIKVILEPRKCKTCGNTLSIYNHYRTCLHHLDHFTEPSRNGASFKYVNQLDTK